MPTHCGFILKIFQPLVALASQLSRPTPCALLLQRMRDLQGELGLQMNQPHMLSALPCDAFCHAFLGLTEQFKCGCWCALF